MQKKSLKSSSKTQLLGLKMTREISSCLWQKLASITFNCQLIEFMTPENINIRPTAAVPAINLSQRTSPLAFCAIAMLRAFTTKRFLISCINSPNYNLYLRFLFTFRQPILHFSERLFSASKSKVRLYYSAL